ncbi:hypothetical protein ACFV1N_14865 [Streptosporangium canum]|uniref:hypothetical protein n=1 Tax=Streptosporangium canum TaxID=324952 RepID=UPI00369EA4F9
MAVRLKVRSGYVRLFCLPAKQPLAEATAGHDAAVEWMPFELRPEPTPTPRPEGDYLRDVWSRAAYLMARTMGVAIRLPDVSPQPCTRLAFESYRFAEEHHLSDACKDRMLRAFHDGGSPA